MSKFKELYDNTFKSNISEEVSSKNGYDYLSWAYAMKHLKINYPEAKIVPVKYPDANGNEVLPFLATSIGYFVTVRLYLNNQDFKDGIFEEFTHPVFDYRNQAIMKPTSMNINNSIQRATAKVIAIATGIGLSLYANEDIPNENNAPAEKQSDIDKAINWLEEAVNPTQFNKRLNEINKKHHIAKNKEFIKRVNNLKNILGVN